MQAILQAAQKDASESHKLAVSMKEDSIAMKTVCPSWLCPQRLTSITTLLQIAILTMLFLPGTSYAVIPHPSCPPISAVSLMLLLCVGNAKTLCTRRLFSRCPSSGTMRT